MSELTGAQKVVVANVVRTINHYELNWGRPRVSLTGPGHYAVYRTLRDTNTVLYTDSGPRCHGLQVSATFEGTGRIVDQSS
jgi:hypothetical protein